MKTLYELVEHVRVAHRLPTTSYNRVSSFVRIPLLLLLLMTLAGCGLFAASDEPEGPLVIRTVHPTFTPTVPPTPAPEQSTLPNTAPDQGTPAPDSAQPNGSGPKGVINGPLVNARSGPGIEFDIIGTLERGAEFDIIGVNPDRAWWHICCVEGAQAWVTSEFVDTLGAVDSVEVVGGASNVATSEIGQSAPSTIESPSPADAAPVTPTAAPAVTFDLETQEQFPESSMVRIFLYVYAGNSALEGYSLSVSKDGAPLPVSGTSFGGQPAFTWPFQDPRQRFQNFKVEFPDTAPAGVWQVQLVDDTGATVGPPGTFTLNANDPQQELYVRYARR